MNKRDRLLNVIGYLHNRLDQMPYDKIVELDLELDSGAVEGAVKNIIGKRCDHRGTRWIEERVEAGVQLRCIEANGDWDSFLEFVHDRMRAEAQRRATRLRQHLDACSTAYAARGSMTWADLYPFELPGTGGRPNGLRDLEL